MSKYGCHNKPRPVADKQLPVQDGYCTIDINAYHRIPQIVLIPFVMSTDCQYTKMHPDDPECANCQHQQK